MARRLAPTTQRAFSAAITAGLKPLSKLWVANDFGSRSSKRILSEDEQLFAPRSNLGAVGNRRTYYTEGGRGSSSSQGGRPNSTDAQAYEEYGQQQQERGEIPRPLLIQWEKDLVNTVQLIGRVGKDITVKYLDSGKVVATTCLAVRKGADKTEEPSWFELEIRDDLAEVAAHHVEKGEQIFVAGRITVDKNVKGDTTYNTVKVFVKELLFVESYNDQRQSHGQEEVAYMGSPQRNWNQQQSANQPPQRAVVQKGSSNNHSEAALATEKRWQEYFSDPTQWWDNREKKKNPKAPDFKHKSIDEALWVKSWNNPPWVAQQLAVLDEKKAQHSGSFGESNCHSHANRLSSFKDSDLVY